MYLHPDYIYMYDIFSYELFYAENHNANKNVNETYVAEDISKNNR